MKDAIKILEDAFPNPTTQKGYKSRLKNLLKTLEPATTEEILLAPDTYYPKLKEAYPSFTTRKNMLTLILVLFREDPTLKTSHEKEHARWKKLHDDLGRIQEAKVKRSEPEEKQLELYTSFEEIESEYRKLKHKTPHATEKSSQQFLLLSVMVNLRPKRADLGHVRIYRDSDPRKTDENYIVLRAKDKGTSYLVMNLYKTSKYYQTIEEDLPAPLRQDLETSLARWPRDYLFTKQNGEPMSNNTYSVFVKNTFEQLFGRKTGVSLLRHIYISEKMDFDDMTLQEQEDEAKYMLHTSGLQRAYKWPKKVLCPKLCAPYIKKTKSTKKSKKPAKPQTKKKARRIPLGIF